MGVPKPGTGVPALGATSITRPSSVVSKPRRTASPLHTTSRMNMYVAGPMGVPGRPNLTGRSTTGMTAPRRFITPRPTAGLEGIEVTRSHWTISRTCSIWSAYSSPIRLKVTYCWTATGDDMALLERVELGISGARRHAYRRSRGGSVGGGPWAGHPDRAGRGERVLVEGRDEVAKGMRLDRHLLGGGGE